MFNKMTVDEVLMCVNKILGSSKDIIRKAVRKEDLILLKNAFGKTLEVVIWDTTDTANDLTFKIMEKARRINK